MNNTDKIRNVVARFFNVPESEVTEAFVFPADRMAGSVARSALAAALKRMAGAEPPSVWKANTYAELIGSASGNNGGDDRPTTLAAVVPKEFLTDSGAAKGGSASLVGIDIEHTINLPPTGDPWSEPFFRENFTDAEIAYCIRQPHPRLSFCGLWCAKEAAIKSGPPFSALKPGQIEIVHDERGCPSLRVVASNPHILQVGCTISISHSDSTAVAVCLQNSHPPVAANSKPETSPVTTDASPALAGLTARLGFVTRFVLLSFLLGAIACILSFLNLWRSH